MRSSSKHGCYELHPYFSSKHMQHVNSEVLRFTWARKLRNVRRRELFLIFLNGGKFSEMNRCSFWILLSEEKLVIIVKWKFSHWLSLLELEQISPLHCSRKINSDRPVNWFNNKFVKWKAPGRLEIYHFSHVESYSFLYNWGQPWLGGSPLTVA